jgi:hypothetical protein
VSVVDIRKENKHGELNGHFDSIVDIPMHNRNFTDIILNAEKFDHAQQIVTLGGQVTNPFMGPSCDSPKASASA